MFHTGFVCDTLLLNHIIENLGKEHLVGDMAGDHTAEEVH